MLAWERPTGRISEKWYFSQLILSRCGFILMGVAILKGGNQDAFRPTKVVNGLNNFENH